MHINRSVISDLLLAFSADHLKDMNMRFGFKSGSSKHLLSTFYQAVDKQQVPQQLTHKQAVTKQTSRFPGFLYLLLPGHWNLSQGSFLCPGVQSLLLQAAATWAADEPKGVAGGCERGQVSSSAASCCFSCLAQGGKHWKPCLPKTPWNKLLGVHEVKELHILGAFLARVGWWLARCQSALPQNWKSADSSFAESAAPEESC